MKRFVPFLVLAVAAFSAMHANQITESQARQIADKFFSVKASRLTASAGQSATHLAYTAESNHFYVFSRGARSGGFVVVAGDDRLPQVLGYSPAGTFTSAGLPPAMQDWIAEMNREIAYLQSHGSASVHKPVKQATAVGPLMTTLWNQDWPYNNLCPTYTVGDQTMRAVTGCVATAMAQIMNYHKWPLQGAGSHSYYCNVNDTDPVTLSADFSQSVYEWDKMLDFYDQNSSQESCDAVAKLMSDAGISIDMGYGSSSGASEMAVLSAMTRYFGYSNRHYLMQRDVFSADEWDQLLVDEISARRPILYCGYAYSQGSLGGHAFVFDGFDTEGYFHVNWGWGGTYDGYFLVSVLAPSSSSDFKYGQDAIFGVVPAADASQVPDVLYVRGLMHPDMYSVPRGDMASLSLSDIYLQGNLIDTVGFDNMGYWSMPYDTIPMELRVIDADGVERQAIRFSQKVIIDGWGPRAPNIDFTPDISLGNGEYTVKVAYSTYKDGNYDSWVCDEYGNSLYCKMQLTDDMVYLSDCFLSAKYNLESMDVDQNIFASEPFNVDVTLSYVGRYGPGGPGGQEPASTTGNVRLVMLSQGQEVATSDPVPVSVAYNSSGIFNLQITAPAQWGRYQLMLVDDSGRMFTPASGWLGGNEDDGIVNIVVVPKSDMLVEDFETMTANNKTNETNVQGQFTKWNFSKCGVRAPGEGKCNGLNSIMMKKPSTFYSVEPVYHHIFMAAATFFNNASAEAKYTLEYSVDNAATWTKAVTMDGSNVASVPGNSITQVIWQLNVRATDPALFRLTMTGGGSAATYVDDLILRYNDAPLAGDVNIDGEVNIADINSLIDLILSGNDAANSDINGDGEVNIADINALIDMILAK